MKKKTLAELQTEREKLQEMHEEARENYTSLNIAYDEAHEDIQAEQKKLKQRKKREHEQRGSERKGMKNIQPTMRYLKEEIQKLDKQIQKNSGSGQSEENPGMRKVANG